MPTFTESYGPISAQKVADVEKRLGVEFPSDYKSFLRTTNGGIPEPNCFNVPARGDALLDILYGIRDERTNADLEWEQEQASLWDPLPSGVIAIGHDPGGSTLLLATAGKKAGHVYYWDRGGLWVREDGQNTFHVADSFAQFLEHLCELRENA